MLYLHNSLMDNISKSDDSAPKAVSSDKHSQTGEQRGGKYFQRVQVGYDSSNKPTYRYFRTKDEWESYVNHISTPKDSKKKHAEQDSKQLKEKVDKEHKESKSRSKQSLFIKDKDKKVSKSLFIRY